MLHSGCILQEVLLKRAADLVEALYGMPHNNQVQTHANEAPFLFLCTVDVIKSAFVSFCYIPVCFKASWGPLYCSRVKACFFFSSSPFLQFNSWLCLLVQSDELITQNTCAQPYTGLFKWEDNLELGPKRCTSGIYSTERSSYA